MTASFRVGDVFDRLAEIPDDSVDLLLTSPPFLALRSYLPADHPDKAKEIGSEPTPADFLDTLLALTAEWRRVLAPHGSICVELGDTYSGSGGGGGDYLEGGMREGQQQFAGSASSMRESNAAHWRAKNQQRDAWPLAKSLCGIPHLYHLSLAYGRNLLTGEASPAGQWRVRNVVAWVRPNPPVGALGDKFRPATSYMTVACVSGSRYFDLDAVRTEWARDYTREDSTKVGEREFNRNGTVDSERSVMANPAGAPPLDWWEIPTAPYKGSHYATWPPALCTRPILSMCPQRVCRTCGKPSERIVEKSEEYAAARAQVGDFKAGRSRDGGLNGTTQYVDGRHMDRADNVTLGWTDCGCGDGCEPTTWKMVVRDVEQGKGPDGKWADLDEWPHDIDPTELRVKRKRKRTLDDLGGCADPTHWRNGLVLDPFAGSGTTLAVATGHGRDAIGIDLDARNADLALARVGPLFLEVDYGTTEAAS